MTSSGIYGVYDVEDYKHGSLPDDLIAKGDRLTLSEGPQGTVELRWPDGGSTPWVLSVQWASPEVSLDEDVLFGDAVSVRKSETESIPLTAAVVFRFEKRLRCVLLAPTQGPPATIAAEANPDEPG